jgi:hypothetical protein
MSTLGSPATAIAPTTRSLHAAAHLMRVGAHALLGRRDFHPPQRLLGPARASPTVGAMEAERLEDLIP